MTITDLQNFPKMLFSQTEDHAFLVGNEAEEAEAISRGYSTKPVPGVNYRRVGRSAEAQAHHDGIQASRGPNGQ